MSVGELSLLALVIYVDILALWCFVLLLLNLVLHVHLQLILWLLIVILHDLDLACTLEVCQDRVSFITLALLAEFTSLSQLILQLITVLEDSDVDSLLLGNLLAISSFRCLINGDLSLWELLDSIRLLRELVLVKLRILDLLLSPIDVHWRNLIALTCKHVLSISLLLLLLIKATIDLARVIELGVLIWIACMLHQ